MELALGRCWVSKTAKAVEDMNLHSGMEQMISKNVHVQYVCLDTYTHGL